jgi:FAD/FMN-containing dehydrogenase/Fe-S oxidoreductase
MMINSASDSVLARRLTRALEGEVLFDAFSRGRYATDASIYQITPLGVVVPKSVTDIEAAVSIAVEEGVAVLPRGGGTSQCGQTVGEALIVDTSKYLNGIHDIDAGARRATVEPGLVLDQLNGQLEQHGLFFPVDISTGNRATLGGMAGNNSCGARSIRYGNMVHNVHAIEALVNGARHRFAPAPGNFDGLDGTSAYAALVQDMRALAARETDEIAARFPKLLRRVGGYNIETIAADGHNMANLLVGSEGTLGFFTRLELDLQPLPVHKVLGICHFASLHDAMAATRHIVALGPSAVELADRALMDLARDVPLFAATIERFIKGQPEAVLLVEFAGDNFELQQRLLTQLGELLGDLGHSDAVAEVIDGAEQSQIWDMRKAGLNIVMSMKGEGKPVSFVEDCAVPLEDLAEYTDRLTAIFAKHGTRGTWYAHASVGCLHVRPVLNMKEEGGAKKMRAIAEEAFEMVREYKGSHSGEHGDGLVRSEFHEAMFGPRIVEAFEAVKDRFDPVGTFNPGKIVRPLRMDDRTLFRYAPGYASLSHKPVFDWSAWGGLLPAVEMCNNNGACRKASRGIMCPSYRATGDERHVTRGRANSLRLALSGQLGADALGSDAMAEAMSLCLSCKGCKRECPTGVDMAKLKIEVLARSQKRLRDHLISYLPRYAPWASRFRWLTNLRNRSNLLRHLGERIGFSARRDLPEWHARPFLETPRAEREGPEVALFADTFNTWFEPKVPRAALIVLNAAGCRVTVVRAPTGRPLCCGRTALAVGDIAVARKEIERSLAVLAPLAQRGVPILGLEPCCLYTLRDEWPALLPGPKTDAVAARAQLFESYLVETDVALPFAEQSGTRVMVHDHCHQKVFAAAGDTTEMLRRVPGLMAEPIESTCCGMAGAFGYQTETYEISMAVGALDLFPALDVAPVDALVVTDGTSCRCQIADGARRQAEHVAVVLAQALSHA